MKLGLSSIVIFSVLFTVTITLSVFFFFIVKEEEKHIIDTMKEEANTLSRVIADNMSSSFERVEEEKELLQVIAEEIHRIEDLVWIEIYDKAGVAVAHTSEGDLDEIHPLEHSKYVGRVLKTGQTIETEKLEEGKSIKFMPIRSVGSNKDEVLGVVEVSILMKPGMEHARLHSELLSKFILSFVGNILTEFSNSWSDIQSMAEQVGSDNKVMWVGVFDEKASIIAHTDKSRIGNKTTPLYEEYVKESLKRDEVLELEKLEENTFSMFLPSYLGAKEGGNRARGVVALVMDMRPFKVQLDAMKKRMVISAFSLTIFIVALLFFLLQRLVIKPVKELTDATQSMAEGDMRGRVNIAGGNELGKLGVAFNSMADNIEKYQSDLLEAKDKAEAATIAKSDFLANMSHEIRTPMTAIVGMIECLSGTEFDDENKKTLYTLNRASENLLLLINDILDLAKIEAKQLVLESIAFNLKGLFSEIESLMGAAAREKGLKLSCEIDSDIALNLMGDPNRLRQVLLNLIGNAIKFTSEGRVDVKVAKKNEHNDRIELLFSISDTGIGIPRDRVDAIFENFTQADTSTTRKFGGTGLGTSISKSIVEAMEGKIWVESVPGEGSIFNFTVKMIKNKSPQVVAVEVEKKEIVWKKALDILVADDSEDNITLIRMHLKNTPHSLDFAENGELAVNKFQSKKYDLVLMDMEMPVMDGYTATREIRKWEQKEGKKPTPIVASTAHAMNEHKERCKDAGCTGHFIKPFSKRDLLETIHKYGDNF